MKVSAIVRICVWTLVASILLGVLMVGIEGGNVFGGPLLSFGNVVSYPNSEDYNIGSGQFPVNDIDELEIHWVSGNVELTPYDGNEIKISESASGSLPEEKQMRYLVKGGRLTVQYSAPLSFFHFFGHTGNKTLEVLVPRSALFDSAIINGTSANLNITGLSAKRVTLESVSGHLTAKNTETDNLVLETVSGGMSVEDVSTGEMKINTVSGGVNVRGDVERALYAESVSGGITVESKICPDTVAMSSISGELAFGLPSNAKGFTARHSSVSGGFHCDFAVETSEKTVVFGDGSTEIHMETVSGGMSIRKS